MAVDLRGPRPAVAGLEDELAVGKRQPDQERERRVGVGVGGDLEQARGGLGCGHEALPAGRAGEQPVEDLLPTDLAFVGGVVALALQRGAELERGLEVRARFADRLEVTIQADGAGAVAVAEHPPVHLCAELAHLGALRVGREFLGRVVERFDLL